MVSQSLNGHPYVGPRPFTDAPEDIARFFGRSREARDIISLILAQRTVVLYGKSGTGKSSLLNAAVLPALEERGIDVFRPPARVQNQVAPHYASGGKTSGGSGNIYIHNVLAVWSGGDAAAAQYASLKDYVMHPSSQSSEDASTTIRVMVFDQFEELFTAYPSHWEKRQDFFDQVDDALDADRRLRVVFVVREDYIANLDSYAHLIEGRLKTRFHLEALLPEQARMAVIKPVESTHRQFESEAADHLVTQLRAIRTGQPSNAETGFEQFVEPVVLQVVCQSLWDSLNEWEQTHGEQITAIGIKEVDRHARIGDALIRFYENCIEQAVNAAFPINPDRPSDQQAEDRKKNTAAKDALREWFEKSLITAAGTRRPVVRAGDQTEGMANAIVDHLVSLHIIYVEERHARTPLYEIVHDRFVEAILASNRRWRIQREQNRAAELRQNQRRFALASLVAFFILAGAVIAVSLFSVRTANEQAAAEFATLQSVENIYADWRATHASGLGGIPEVTLAQTPLADFLATATVQFSLAEAWTPESRTLDGVELVMVPKGCFWMGNLNGPNHEQPIFETCPGPFWIDRYEVSNGQFAALSQSDTASVGVDESNSEVPKTFISWEEANSYCINRHEDEAARLPTEVEWEYAARGPNSRLFPWGNTFIAENVNFYQADPEATPAVTPEQNPDPVRNADGSPARPAGASWIGAYDMSGNAREWTATIYNPEIFPYPLIDSEAANDTELEDDTILRVTRGGTWTTSDITKLTTYGRLNNAQGKRLIDTGFRCMVGIDE